MVGYFESWATRGIPLRLVCAASGIEDVPRDMPVMVHKHEKIIPAGQSGGNQFTFNVNVSGGGNARDIEKSLEHSFKQGKLKMVVQEVTKKIA